MRRFNTTAPILTGFFLGIVGIVALVYSQDVLHSYLCSPGSCALPFGASGLGDFVLMSYAGLILIVLGAGLFTTFTTIYVVQHRKIN